MASRTAGLRLLGEDVPDAPLPDLDVSGLLALVEAAGLTGRGGAGFPTAIKVRAVVEAGRSPVVVGKRHGG